MAEHACALIHGPRGLLLELRPASARRAPGQLTCFGGSCEPHEDPETALRRELGEELDWQPRRIHASVALYKGPRWVAQFFTIADPLPHPLHCRIPDHHAIWVPWPSLPGVPLSPWHAAVINAWQHGHSRVDLITVPHHPDQHLSSQHETGQDSVL
ncbi:MAG: NUDIX domain-containing protein [Planctomycetota bacterium]|nr:MAG: NUDIX domain-containing protein [Planctomycetota bacterium]